MFTFYRCSQGEVRATGIIAVFKKRILMSFWLPPSKLKSVKCSRLDCIRLLTRANEFMRASALLTIQILSVAALLFYNDYVACLQKRRKLPLDIAQKSEFDEGVGKQC